MSRQQARHAGRSAAKASKAAKKTPKPALVPVVSAVLRLKASDLTERQVAGYELFVGAAKHNKMSVPVTDEVTWWLSQQNSSKVYHVERKEKNRRGTMVVEYTCSCDDFLRYGRIDCKHVFAERLRRREVAVLGTPSVKERTKAKARRRPARKRRCTTGPNAGKTIRTSQKKARVKMPTRIPLLVVSLKAEADRDFASIVIPDRPQKYKGGRKGVPLTTRATALLAKVASGTSAEEMVPEFERMISENTLKLRQAPCPDRFSAWINDERLTPILLHFLRATARPFIRREIGAIVDSSKVSQLMNTSAMGMDYLGDERDNANWMKCHTIVGVETMIVMDVDFSDMHDHDINFLEPLVERVTKEFPLRYLLADKAYLSEQVLQFLWDRGIKAAIPVKKKQWNDPDKAYSQPITHLVEWYDKRYKDFHEVYRLRPKIEALFSLMKRMAQGFCWSRGRKRKHDNEFAPSTAWKNEVLCKLIYINLRTTVTLEEETGTEVDYLVRDRLFHAPDEPLLKTAA